MIQVLKDIVLFNHVWSFMFYSCVFYLLIVFIEKLYSYISLHRKTCRKCRFVENCNTNEDASKCSLYQPRKVGGRK